MNTLASSQALSALANGGILTANAWLNVPLTARSPVSFDLHWLRSLAGLVTGSSGIRIDARTAASISLTVAGHCTATARQADRAGHPRLHLTLETSGAPARKNTHEPGFSVRVAFPSLSPYDPLSLALTGQHPLQHLRRLFLSLGSPECSTFLDRSGIAPRDFAVFAPLWPNLTARTEAVLWRAGQSPAHLSAIAEATHWLANECPSAGALWEFLSTPSGEAVIVSLPYLNEWFEALTGTPLFAPLSGEAFRQAALAARDCLPLLRLPELANLLAQLRHSPPSNPSQVSGDVGDLSLRLHAAAGPVLAQQLSLDLSRHFSSSTSGTVLLDASFSMDAAGLASYRRALAGDLASLAACAFPAVDLHPSNLEAILSTRRSLEIHLPFLFSAHRQHELASLAQCDLVPATRGRIEVVRRKSSPSHAASHSVHQTRLIIAAALSAKDGEPASDNLTLSFRDVRDFLPGHDLSGYLAGLAAYGIKDVIIPAGPVRATFEATLPGSLLRSWATLPLSRREALDPILWRVSLALQASLRRWLAMIHRTDPATYSAPALIFPLLAYQHSKPYARVRLGVFGYDSMDPASVDIALNSAATGLSAALPDIQARLIALGRPALAAQYAPENLPSVWNAVTRHKRVFCTLLSADSFLIEQVLSLARHCRHLSTLAASQPRRAARALHTLTTEFSKVYHGRLSRLPGGQDHTSLGALLLMEATAALAGQPDALRATLSLQPLPQQIHLPPSVTPDAPGGRCQ